MKRTLFLDYDPDSSEIYSVNEASEENMKVRYTYLLPKESDVITTYFENQIVDISKTLHQVLKELIIKVEELHSYQCKHQGCNATCISVKLRPA